LTSGVVKAIRGVCLPHKGGRYNVDKGFTRPELFYKSRSILAISTQAKDS